MVFSVRISDVAVYLDVRQNWVTYIADMAYGFWHLKYIYMQIILISILSMILAISVLLNGINLL